MISPQSGPSFFLTGSDPAGNFQNRQLAQRSEEPVLEGETPRMIDEWQEVPPLWDAVRYIENAAARTGKDINNPEGMPQNGFSIVLRHLFTWILNQDLRKKSTRKYYRVL